MTETSDAPRRVASQAFVRRHALTQLPAEPVARASTGAAFSNCLPAGKGYPKVPDIDLLTGAPQPSPLLPPHVRFAPCLGCSIWQWANSVFESGPPS